jgi:predicted 3-demethylubiquinone-9 3-methyltransferase (glyoxalase superfamily)
MMSQKFSTCLWFDNNAEEAVNFYTSIFTNSKIESVSRYGDAGPGEEGAVMTIVFKLFGQEFMALNGGPVYSFTPAISFIVHCETQAEVDDYWQKLTSGGQEVQCGWLTDKFGLSWQIVPTVLGELMSDPDGEKVRRVTEAMLSMVKLDIAGLKRAYESG